MMASSQVEIATSSPFAVHSRRDPFSFRNNNLNQLVTSSCGIPNDTSRHIDLDDLWVHQPQWQTTTTTNTGVASNKCNNNNHDDQANDYNSNIIVNKDKDKWARAREMVFSVDHHCSGGKGGGSDSPKHPERLLEVSNLRGVSSLVQKWRGFEAEAKFNSKSNNTNTAAMLPENAASAGPAAPVGSSSSSEDDSFGDWESDRTAFSTGCPTSSRGRDSDATESERLRVADIIRKLTEDRFNNDVGSDSPPPQRVRTSSSDQTTTDQQRCYSPVLSSPRLIRGRQAYNDLLTQMERDRQKELQGLVGRKAVSKFSHRGRIQALLRFKFLRRGMEAKEECRHSNSTTSSQSHKALQSAVTHLRERVHPSAQNGSVHSGSCHKELTDNSPAETSLCVASQQGKENQRNELTNLESCSREDHIQDSQCSMISKEQDVGHTSHKVNGNIQQKDHLLHGYEVLQHEASPSTTFMSQEINRGNSNDSLPKFAETATALNDTETNFDETTESLHSMEINVHEKEEDVTNHQVTKSNYDMTGDCESCHKGDEDIVGTSMYWVSDVSHPEVGWQESHSDYEQQEVNNRDWIDEVSRPRSDWEGLRQARYQEMLDPFLDNEEIRALLGRRSVSTFLSSGLREKIDRVMISRAEGQQTPKSNRTQEGKDELLPEQEQSVVCEEGEGDDEQDEEGEVYGNYFDEYEEAESSVGQQYNESDDSADNTTPASWPQNQGHELSDYSYQVASPSTQQSSSHYYSQDNGPTNSSAYSAHPAIEMELIYDLRGHMEQLHQEMSELRKSIKCCMDMQIKLQRSIKKEVATALNHSGANNNGRRNSVKKVTSGGRCCVCCKMQVDSLLYRCGHMCTCFKCAHELQWSSGKCPICRAPIVDVVRTFSNYS